MSSSYESIIRRAFSDPLAFEELNEFLADHSRYRKSVMRVWFSRETIEELRMMIPNLPPGLALARDAIMALLDEVPACQSADPQTTLDRLKSYLEMKASTESPKMWVRNQTPLPPRPQTPPQLTPEQIRALLQLLQSAQNEQQGE